MKNPQEIWSEFCSEQKVIKEAVHLFDSDKNGYVETKRIGKNKREIIRRSGQVEELIRREVTKVRNAFEASTNRCDGVIYIIGKKDQNIFFPLYIGKSEKFGKGEQNFSSNLDCSQSDLAKFARWGYGYAYHMGDLSAASLSGHPKDKVTEKYQRWAELIFTKVPSTKLLLKDPIWFWMKAWSKENLSPWKEIGPVGVAGLEYILIILASQIFPNLLNDEGRSRG